MIIFHFSFIFSFLLLFLKASQDMVGWLPKKKKKKKIKLASKVSKNDMPGKTISESSIPLLSSPSSSSSYIKFIPQVHATQLIIHQICV